MCVFRQKHGNSRVLTTTLGRACSWFGFGCYAPFIPASCTPTWIVYKASRDLKGIGLFKPVSMA